MVSTKVTDPSPAAEHRTVTRVMGILESVAAAEPQGVRLGELADAVDAPKSSIHGLAKGLVATGYLAERDGRYFRGPGIASLLGGAPGASVAYRYELEQLSQRFGETAVLSSLVGDAAVHLDAVEAPQMIRVSPALHQRRPLWPVSYGKCFLAFMPPQKIEAYLRRQGFEEPKLDTMRAELEQVRETRIAVNRDHELIGVASPLVSTDGTVSLAIGITGPASRMVDKLESVTTAVRSVADALSSKR